MLYVAYGSNLSRKEMRRKCPHARMVCVATRDSVGGEIDIQGKKGDKVWGVVYQIDEMELAAWIKMRDLIPGVGASPVSEADTRELNPFRVHAKNGRNYGRRRSLSRFVRFRTATKAEARRSNPRNRRFRTFRLRNVFASARMWRAEYRLPPRGC
jgi:hypothetical protein